MTKSIQSSYAGRIGKAETLYTTLMGFTDYHPGDSSLTANGIRLYIDNLFTIQQTHAERYNAFTTAVQARQNLFSGEKPLGKTMTMVKNYVAAAYGKESDKSKNVNKIILKIRGEKPIKITNDSGESSISRSEKSYGAQHVNLSYLVSTLSGFGSTYTPANPSISIEALSTLADAIYAANDNTVQAYQALHPLVIHRQAAFNEFGAVVQRVKQMVLSQYGSGSVEYKAIKGMDFRIL